MKPKWTAVLFIVAVSAGSSALAIQKDKRPDVGNFAFWTTAKGGPVGPFVPGLNAVLMLTDQQKEQIIAARRETIESDAVQEAGRTIKVDPNATEAQKQTARETIEAARRQLGDRVAGILTADQKAIVERISGAFDEVYRSVAEEFKPRFAGAKGNEQEQAVLKKEFQEKLEAEFLRKLDGMLNAEQKAALAKAAAEAKERAAKSSGDKKPK